MKLFALPLSRTIGTKPPLFYLHAKKLPANSPPTGNPSRVTALANRATNWAADNWTKLGQAKEGSWKRRAYATGDRFMDRIEFEEWSLKAIDPALSPKPWAVIATGSDGSKAERERARDSEAGKVSLLYPPSLLTPGPLLDALKAQLAHREPHHKGAMYKCLFGAPLTIPFALIPVVPNFPLFYVLWRAWSHWRAWKSSEYLNTLLSKSQITLVPSPALDTVYASSAGASPAPDTELLLTLDKVPKLVAAFKLTEEEGQELKRAVVQAEARLKQGFEETEKGQEKRD